MCDSLIGLGLQRCKVVPFHSSLYGRQHGPRSIPLWCVDRINIAEALNSVAGGDTEARVHVHGVRSYTQCSWC